MPDHVVIVTPVVCDDAQQATERVKNESAEVEVSVMVSKELGRAAILSWVCSRSWRKGRAKRRDRRIAGAPASPNASETQ